MGNTFYAQSEHRGPTMTVGQLIEHLAQFDKDLPVIFQSPRYGCFGSNTTYTIDEAAKVAYEREEIHYPACTAEDHETGEPYAVEAWTDVKLPWEGVVIS